MNFRALCFLILFGAVAWCGDTPPKIGYVDCSLGDRMRQIPVFPNVCSSKPVGNLTCGEQVTVVGREGQWLKIEASDGVGGYLSAAAISQKKDQFSPMDITVPANAKASDCGALLTGDRKYPSAVYQVNPIFSPEARKKHIQGTVTMLVTIGVDGLPRDIKLQKGLGYGLDQNAIRALEQWRFEPATQNGQAVEKRVAIEMSFSFYN